MTENYSVLMSVYYKEKPEYLKESMLSMFNQTIPTNDFVLVCDGPLSADLDAVIHDMELHHEELHVIRLEKNSGLGNALNIGMKHCKNELIARMDSDDIAKKNRCDMELNRFINDSTLDIISCTVYEFEDYLDNVIGKREVPCNNESIIEFSRKRNPFNHPSVMFKKSKVIAAGGYSERFHLFEDYYLWIRMLQQGDRGENIHRPLLYMRSSVDMYLRRGGLKYAFELLKFHWWIMKSGWSGWRQFFSGAIPHALVCILPSAIRRKIYRRLHS